MVIREWGWRNGDDEKMGMGNMGGKFWEWGDGNGGMGMSNVGMEIGKRGMAIPPQKNAPIS